MGTVVIGIAGGTGSGKTTVARSIYHHFPSEHICLLEQDSYYRPGRQENWDHPLAFDNDLLIEHIRCLKSGQAVEKPVYDFTIHDRRQETVRVGPCRIIIVEGILILEDARLRELLDIKIFVDTDADVRFIRRLLRDIKERGRTMESVVEQYLNQVRPSHLQFVEPTRRYADLIIPEGGHNQVAIDVVIAKIRSILEG